MKRAKAALLPLAVSGVIALLIGLVSLSALFTPKSNHTCRVSGRIATPEGRPVARGTVRFFCVLASEDETDSRRGVVSFPILAVPIVNGEYHISEEDGLVPGSYEVTVRPEGGKATIMIGLIHVANGSGQIVDFHVKV
jgi:hypothetical protein